VTVIWEEMEGKHGDCESLAHYLPLLCRTSRPLGEHLSPSWSLKRTGLVTMIHEKAVMGIGCTSDSLRVKSSSFKELTTPSRTFVKYNPTPTHPSRNGDYGPTVQLMYLWIHSVSLEVFPPCAQQGDRRMYIEAAYHEPEHYILCTNHTT